MPSLTNHQSRDFTKILVIGDSKLGKTGALASLVKAGYKLRILDYDNGLDTLAAYVKKTCPENLGNVHFRTLRDKKKVTAAGIILDGAPKAFVNGVEMLARWREGDTDLGVPATWGPECILVVDSLTFMSDAAWDWRETLTPRGASGKYDIRAVYKDAQEAVESLLGMLTSESFRTNVIVISHAKYIENTQEGTVKGYPTSVGSALSPKIPAYFNNYFRFTTKGAKRIIQAKTSPMFDLANARPFEMKDEFDIENGMAQIFEVLRK